MVKHKRKSGLAFHCHHDTLAEYVYDYDERVRFIKENKPKDEQELRLRLFQLIPIEKVPGGGSKAWDAYKKARDACDKARDACDKAWDAYKKARDAYDKARDAYKKAWDACDKARDAYDKARDACDKARDACDKAWDAYKKKYQVQIEELHRELCPNCPWDGKTIFTKEAVKWLN